MEEDYEKQRKEFRALSQYINNFPYLIREEGQSFVPPKGVSIEVVGDIDRIKSVAQGANVWIKGI